MSNLFSKISPSIENFYNNVSQNEKREVFVLIKNKSKSVSFNEFEGTKDDFFEYKLKDNSNLIEELKSETFYGTHSFTPDFQKVGEGILPVFQTKISKKELNRLASLDNVLAIIPNLKIKEIKPTATYWEDPDQAELADGVTWGIKELRIDELWEKGINGDGVKVAVLDTGVDGEHEALKGKISDYALIDNAGRIKKFQNNETYDSGRHGTHVCGTIAGDKCKTHQLNIGVAPGAQLLVGAVLAGKGNLTSLFNGIEWAMLNGARIINMSLGISTYEPKLSEYCEELVEEHNIIPIAAIGNESHGNSSSPGNNSFALGVGAVEKGFRGRLGVAHYSSGASLKLNGDEPFIVKPDIVAPGSGVYSCIPSESRYERSYNYVKFDGTSMACPHVSGICALLLQKFPDAKAFEIIEVLKSTAEYKVHRSVPPDNRWGFGMVRPYKAIEKLEQIYH